MANRTLTADIIAKEALRVLENNTVMARLVYRGYEDEFDDTVNGYKKGDTISIRRPPDFTVREGAVMAVQDVVEGKTTIVIDKQRGIDFEFTSKQLTLEIGELSERVIKPAMISLANSVDVELMNLYKKIPNWVGGPTPPINSFADFYLGVERMDEFAAPMDDRAAVLSPPDHAGLIGSQTGLYISDVAKDAYRRGSLGMLGNVDTNMDQNVGTLTVGSRTGSILVDLSIVTTTITYAAVQDTMLQTIHIDALGGATQTIAEGEVFTIAGVYAVNPVSKARLAFLKQFVVTAAAVGSGSECDLIIYPAMIWTGSQQNVDVVGVTDLNNQAVTFMGTASTAYRQNLMFHKNAFALVMVPMIKPPGSVDVSRQSYKGISVRVWPVADGVNDVSKWRTDILFGVKALDPRIAVRVSGT